MYKYKVYRSIENLDKDILKHELVAVEYGESLEEVSKKLMTAAKMDAEGSPKYERCCNADVSEPKDASYRKAKRYQYSMYAHVDFEASLNKELSDFIEYGIVKEPVIEQPPNAFEINSKTIWNKETYNEFLDYLKSLTGSMNRKLDLIHVNDSTLKKIDVKPSDLRKIAKKIVKGNYLDFIKCNRDEFYEERTLYGLVLCYVQIDYKTLLKMIRDYTPYFSYSNSVISLLIIKIKELQKNEDVLLKDIMEFTVSKNRWEIEFGLMMFTNLYINEKYIDEILEIASQVKHKHESVRSSNATLIHECYEKFPEKTTKLLKKRVLDSWTQNVTINRIRWPKKDDNFLKELEYVS